LAAAEEAVTAAAPPLLAPSVTAMGATQGNLRTATTSVATHATAPQQRQRRARFLLLAVVLPLIVQLLLLVGQSGRRLTPGLTQNLDQPRVTLELRDSPTALAYSPDGVFVATVGRDGVLRLWDAKTGAQQSLIDVRRPCRAVSFSPDGAHLAVATDEGIHIFDRATYKVIRELPAPQIRSLAFSPNGQTLLAGITSNGQVPTLVELETATGKMRRALFPRPAPLQGLVMAAPVLGVAASAGGETLAALFRSVDVREPANGNVRRPASSSVVNVWDAQTARCGAFCRRAPRAVRWPCRPTAHWWPAVAALFQVNPGSPMLLAWPRSSFGTPAPARSASGARSTAHPSKASPFRRTARRLRPDRTQGAPVCGTPTRATRSVRSPPVAAARLMGVPTEPSPFRRTGTRWPWAARTE
jgi:hypothetical protein